MKEIKGTYEYISQAIIKLHEEFRRNHKLKLKSTNVRIGRSNSLSHIFERSLANSLSKKFTEYIFLVDYPITLKDSNNKSLGTIYPDIMVIKDISISNKINKGKVIAIMDLKLDLGYVDLEYYGYKKDKKTGEYLKINNYTKGFVERENKIKASEKCCFNYIVGANSKEEIEINKKIGKLEATFNKDIKKISFICTDQNSHSRENIFKTIMESSGYEVIYLLKGIHPNTIENKKNLIKKEIERNKDEINKILN